MKKISMIILTVLLVGCSPTNSNTLPATGNTTSAQTTVSQTTITQTSAATTTATKVSDLSAEEIVKELKKAGVEIGKVVTYTEETDSNNLLGRPNQYTSKSNFSLKGDEEYEDSDPENTIEVFEKEADAKARKEYVEQVMKGLAFATQYVYHHGNYVLRIDNQTTPTKAKIIEEAFYQIVK